MTWITVLLTLLLSAPSTAPAPITALDVAVDVSGATIGKWKQIPAAVYVGLSESGVKVLPVKHQLRESFLTTIHFTVMCEVEGPCIVLTYVRVSFRDNAGKRREVFEDLVERVTEQKEHAWIYVAALAGALPVEIGSMIQERWSDYLRWKADHDEAWIWRHLVATNTSGSDA